MRPGLPLILVTLDEDVARQTKPVSAYGRQPSGGGALRGRSQVPPTAQYVNGSRKRPLDRSGVRLWFSSVWDAAAAMTTNRTLNFALHRLCARGPPGWASSGL